MGRKIHKNELILTQVHVLLTKYYESQTLVNNSITIVFICKTFLTVVNHSLRMLIKLFFL